jgi:hypothetical protein
MKYGAITLDRGFQSTVATSMVSLAVAVGPVFRNPYRKKGKQVWPSEDIKAVLAKNDDYPILQRRSMRY